MKGFVIAGTGSGVGKTSITAGLMHTLSKRMKVQGYKVGPDFIDPMYHEAATGRPSRNLDTFMMTPEKVRNLAMYGSEGSDISIVEGVRGLYEGISGTSDRGSTAEMAKLLGLPVILVVNARSLTRSAAAMIRGFCSFDEDVNIAGVILNQVSGEQHEGKLREAMTANTDVRILGTVKRDPGISMKERYLGLETIHSGSREKMENLDVLVSDIDVDALLDICAGTDQDHVCPYTRRNTGLKAAVPMDDAYCFYYRENLECMEASGIGIEYFSPIKGDVLPDADIYYLGGGYPELYLDAISENRDMMEGLKNASEEGKVIIGECGGLMTLCSSIKDESGREHKGAGIFEAKAEMTDIRHGPKYTVAEPTAQNTLFRETVRGHEFHYSHVSPEAGSTFGFSMARGQGIAGGMDGLVSKNTLGTYTHQHALSVDDWLRDVVRTIT